MFGTRFAAQAAQIIGQALTGWAFVLWLTEYMLDEPGGLVLWSIILLIAIALPARLKESDRERAYANFASGSLVWGLSAWGILTSLLEYALGGAAGSPLSAVQMLMLVATVMFMFSGAFFWVLSRESTVDQGL